MYTAIVLLCALLFSLPDAASGETPAEARIGAARARIERAAAGAERARGLLALAAAHTARARESADAAHYEQALRLLERAREAGAEPGEIAKLEAWVRLGRHEFAAAEALARARVTAHPGDHEAWGLLGDACMELGRSDAAGEAYQHMMDLKPGPGAYLRAAYFRERTGDPAGALAFLERALAATAARETEQRAWTLVQMASLEERLGRAERAEASLERALASFPDYHYALAALARHHVRLGHFEAALPLAHRALDAAPHAELWLTLADALRGLGREDEARAAEDAFEAAALENLEKPDNENIFLVDFYLDRRPDPLRALEIAQLEAARRPAPATLERLARARQRSASALPESPLPQAGEDPERGRRPRPGA
jgi:tetratricopeptide (TPR) repeat protein